MILAAFVLYTLGPVPMVAADEIRLPAPGVMVHLSPEFDPPTLKGIKVHADDPFRFDFILDSGDAAAGHVRPLQEEATKLIKYFLAGLTIPDKDIWVNLSPYEKDRIIPQSFGLTEMGRDLLAEDYMLKQVTASLIYPEDQTGKKFWKRVYAQAQRKYGTTDIPVNTFNKVWIVPGKAVVYENASAESGSDSGGKAASAYVVQSTLKVMLEQDYLSLLKHSLKATHSGPVDVLGTNIIREIVIPELTKEVNVSKNFAQLRQVYNSLILATWYKKKIRDSILSQVYEDKSKIVGVSYGQSNVPHGVEFIYQRYLQAFKKGVYNYIKEDQDPMTQQMVPRKYFSGGFSAAMMHLDQAAVVPTGNSRKLEVVNAAITIQGTETGGSLGDTIKDRIASGMKHKHRAVLIDYNNRYKRGNEKELVKEILEIEGLNEYSAAKSTNKGRQFVEITQDNLQEILSDGWQREHGNIEVYLADKDFLLDGHAGGEGNDGDKLAEIIGVQHMGEVLTVADLTEAQKESFEGTDDLTGLYGKARTLWLFKKMIRARLKLADIHAEITIWDADNFGVLNNIFGHPLGDKVLRRFAQVLQNNTRAKEEKDILSRWGGEEFIFVTSNGTFFTGRQAILERILKLIKDEVYKGDGDDPEWILDNKVEIIKKLKTAEADTRHNNADSQRIYEALLFQLALQNDMTTAELRAAVNAKIETRKKARGGSVVIQLLRPWRSSLRKIASLHQYVPSPLAMAIGFAEGSIRKGDGSLYNFDKWLVTASGGSCGVDTDITPERRGNFTDLEIITLFNTAYAKADEQLLRAKGGGRNRIERTSVQHVDFAMKVVNGGIDLTAVNTQILNNGRAVKFHIDPAMLQQLQNALGFVPVIIHMQPMTDLRAFLGFKDQSSSPAVS